MIQCSPQVQVSHPCGLPLLPTASTNPALDCVNTIPYIRFDRQARWIEFCRFVKRGYYLYFPEEVHNAGLHLFDVVEQANLPSLDTLPEADRLPHLRTLFESLYDGTHPLRIALTKLHTLDTVRIIEGKA